MKNCQGWVSIRRSLGLEATALPTGPENLGFGVFQSYLSTISKLECGSGLKVRAWAHFQIHRLLLFQRNFLLKASCQTEWMASIKYPVAIQSNSRFLGYNGGILSLTEHQFKMAAWGPFYTLSRCRNAQPFVVSELVTNSNCCLYDSLPLFLLILWCCIAER